MLLSQCAMCDIVDYLHNDNFYHKQLIEIMTCLDIKYKF